MVITLSDQLWYKTIHVPTCEKEIYFVKKQELHRKDVERAFGVLEPQFAIVRDAT